MIAARESRSEDVILASQCHRSTSESAVSEYALTSTIHVRPRDEDIPIRGHPSRRSAGTSQSAPIAEHRPTNDKHRNASREAERSETCVICHQRRALIGGSATVMGIDHGDDPAIVADRDQITGGWERGDRARSQRGWSADSDACRVLAIDQREIAGRGGARRARDV